MLLNAELPLEFWSEALNTSLYLRNRLPSKTLNDKSPYELWFDEKPILKYIKVFKCIAFNHINKARRNSKFSPRAEKCIMVGYNSDPPLYRMYNPERDMIINSRDATFMEQAAGGTILSTDRETSTRNLSLILNLLSPHNREEEVYPTTSLEPVVQGQTDGYSTTTLEDNPGSAGEARTGRTDRPRRNVGTPQYYGNPYLYFVKDTPSNYEQAIKMKDADDWRSAMDREIQSMNELNVWE